MSREQQNTAGVNVINLTDLKKGTEATVAELSASQSGILRKLMAVGILPGLPLTVIQTFPTYVIRVGYTQIALDKELASAIQVRLER